MTQVIQRAQLFLGSYALLFTLLAIRFEITWLEVACAALATLGFLDMLWIVFGVTRRKEPEPIVPATVSDAGSDVAGYLATYLLPFLTVAEPNTRDVIAYILFLLVTGLIYVRSEMTQINPTLYLLCRRVVRVTTTDGWSGYVIMRTHPEPSEPIKTVSLNAEVRVEAKRKQPTT
jgi:hypothetical protein